jgi:hypothetical protein
MLEHLAARFFALAALFRALPHVFIIVLRTFLAASAACLRTGCADEVGEHTLPRGDTGRSGAVVGTIETSLQRNLVFFLALRE